MQIILADTIAYFLNKELPIFNYGSSLNATDTLHLHLKSEGGGFIYDLLLDIQFFGQKVVKESQEIWKLNDNDSWYAHTIKSQDPNIFVANVYQRFKDLFDRDLFVAQFFRNRMISGEAIQTVDFTGKKWTLSLTYEELPIGFETRIKILQAHAGNTRKFFAEVRGFNVNQNTGERIITKALDILSINNEFVDPLSELTQADFESMIGFSIIKYEPFRPLNVANQSGL